MKIFTLEDYNQIIFDGFSYQLPGTISLIVQSLTKEVETFAPQGSVVTEDKTKRPFNSVNKKSRVRRNDSHEDWNAGRSFKSTVIEKKEGSDKIANDIRACLNKISSKNYDNQKVEIIKLVEELSQMDKSDTRSVALAIYDIASNNKFNSLIYANLYKELSTAFSELAEPFDEFLDSYKENVSKINHADPNDDYDKYCEYIKANDKRRAISTFLSNLVKIDYLSKDRIIDVILNSQNIILDSVDTENKTNEVDEITENLSIFVSILRDDLKGHPDWIKIIDNINKCAQMKAKDKKSLSSRSVFKYMDILENINK
jgi:hypothetical protein